jgi:hypothetical protein
MNDTMQRHGSVLLPAELLPSSLSFVGRFDKSSQVFKKTTLSHVIDDDLSAFVDER